MRIAAGRLSALTLPSPRAIRPLGVLLFSYAKLKLAARDRRLRRAIPRVRLAARHRCARRGARRAIAAEGEPAVVIAHSMGGLVARVAARRLPQAAAAQAHHAGYAEPRGSLRVRAGAARQLSLRAQDLAARSQAFARILAAEKYSGLSPVFITCCRPRRRRECDLLDPRAWPARGRAPDARLLAGVGVPAAHGAAGSSAWSTSSA